MIAQNWLAHRVQRFHTNPHLARFAQTNADHAHGVASIIAALNPNASAALLRAALWHDAGERWAGDLPQPFKATYPDIAEQHSKAEDYLRTSLLGAQPDLTADEKLWLKLGDGLEAILFCAFHRPNLLSREDWDEYVGATIDRAELLGVGDWVVSAIQDMAEEGAE